MPSGYLHKRFALEACKQADVSITEEDVFVMGAQGPDPLFTLGIFPLRFSSKPKRYGKILHTTRTGAFLCKLCELAREKGDVQQAYTMGFLTHYALDSTVHPYVYAHSLDQYGNYSSAIHMRLEKNWDAIFYQRDGYSDTPVAMPGVQESQAAWPLLALLLSRAVGDVYPETPLPKEEALEAFQSTVKANKLTHSPGGTKFAVASVVEKLFAKNPYMLTSQISPLYPIEEDIENKTHEEWTPPAEPERVRTESLEDLYQMALYRAAELLRAAQAYMQGKQLSMDALQSVIGNVGYDTGIQSLP